MTDAAPTPPQFVVHAHDAPPLHYDLMLEWGAVLATWEVAQPPVRASGEQPVTPKADHRRHYLTYEGAVSEGRGTTAIWDRGSYEARRGADGVMFLRFSGERVEGWYRLGQHDGAWSLMPIDAVPGDAEPLNVEVQRDAGAAEGAAAAAVAPEPKPPRERKPRARRNARSLRLSTKILLGLSILVFLGGVAYLTVRSHYKERFRGQAYVQILITYRDIGREKDQAVAVQMEADLEAKLLGQEIEIIGRVGAIEPITSREGATHPGGTPVRLWVDVPNVVEPANADRKDAACVIPHSELDFPPVEGEAAPAPTRGAHAHRYHRGDLVRVVGRLEKFNVASNGSRASLTVVDAHIVPMSGVEEHFFRAEARTLGPIMPLKGITDPYRDRRDAHGRIKDD
jgi:hypothetical protein